MQISHVVLNGIIMAASANASPAPANDNAVITASTTAEDCTVGAKYCGWVLQELGKPFQIEV
jgi:hypothetical protein